MPPKKMQKRKTLAELTTKDKSVSRDCRVSARRQLNPMSTMIPDFRRTLRSSNRRHTLRSSKMPIETGTTSLSRCSRPHITRRHSAAPDDIQKLDFPAQTINTADQVPEEGSDQIESPLRCLVSDPVAHPPAPTLEPELGQKEVENVENSTVGVQGIIEEEDEAENSLSIHSNLMVGQNTFEEESTPTVEEITNKNDRRSFSRVGGYSSPSFSLKLTEMAAMAAMADEEEDDEIDSERQNRPQDTVNGYQVQPELMPTLRKIISKHGDIAKSCLATSVKWRSALLETICGIISELDKKDVTNIKGKDLKKMIDDVSEISNLKVEVEWLHTRLIEILEARRILKQSGTLKEKKDSIKKFIEIAESELKECEAEKNEVSKKLRDLSEKLKAVCDKEADWKERLARMQDESTKTLKRFKDAKSKVSRFLNGSLVYDLL